MRSGTRGLIAKPTLEIKQGGSVTEIQGLFIMIVIKKSCGNGFLTQSVEKVDGIDAMMEKETANRGIIGEYKDGVEDMR